MGRGRRQIVVQFRWYRGGAPKGVRELPRAKDVVYELNHRVKAPKIFSAKERSGKNWGPGYTREFLEIRVPNLRGSRLVYYFERLRELLDDRRGSGELEMFIDGRSLFQHAVSMERHVRKLESRLASETARNSKLESLLSDSKHKV